MDDKTILYATDYSPASQGAMKIASLLARQTGATLLIAHVSDRETYPVGELFDEEMAPDRARTRGIARRHVPRPAGEMRASPVVRRAGEQRTGEAGRGDPQAGRAGASGRHRRGHARPDWTDAHAHGRRRGDDRPPRTMHSHYSQTTGREMTITQRKAACTSTRARGRNRCCTTPETRHGFRFLPFALHQSRA